MKKINDEAIFYISAGAISLFVICLIAAAGVHIYKEIPQDKSENNNISVTEASAETNVATEEKSTETTVEKFCGVDVIYID